MASVLRSLGSGIWQRAIDATYPRTCAMCGQRGDWVCDLCVTEYTPLRPDLCCDRCGHPKVGRCECKMMHPAIEKARAVSAYDGWIARAVKSLKYDRERDRARHLAEQMEPAFRTLSNPDVLIPVPLHTTRYEWRGFNQAELLARHIGSAFALPVESALTRVKFTEAQTRSSRDDRIANMKGAFALSANWNLDRSAHYVLVDDVYTTGATINACAEVLEAAGAQRISVITVAFDLKHRELEQYRAILSATLP